LNSKPLFKSEPQLLKCYSKKPEGKIEKQPETINLPIGEKIEKNDEKEYGAMEEKLSNVSTSFSSKEKPLEEELMTPMLHTFKKTDTQTGTMPIFQINLILPNETKSSEIFQVI